MNQLKDISMNKAFSGVCGISENELTSDFEPEIQALADGNNMTRDEALAEMRKRYNGYRFAPDAEAVYNPFSVLNTLDSHVFGYYWFRTGTPTFLIKQIKAAKFNIPDFTQGVSIHAQSIDDYRANGDNPVPLLYQTGYLTIMDYNPRLRKYTLGFPNEEVKYAFLNELLDSYFPRGMNMQRLFVGDFAEDLWKGDIETFITRLRSLIASMPYGVKSEETESWFQTVVYLLFTLLGQYVQAEVHSHKGRADMVVITDDSVYVFEFKITGGKDGKTADAALKQIYTPEWHKTKLPCGLFDAMPRQQNPHIVPLCVEPASLPCAKNPRKSFFVLCHSGVYEKDYMGQYRASGKRLCKIAAIYDTTKRELGETKIS